MTVIPVANSLIDEEESAVKLVRYAFELGISEDQFYGISNPSTQIESCHPIWSLQERQSIARYLKEAQDEIEPVTGYPLSPRWFTDEFKYYGFPLHAKWSKIIAAGFKNTSTISAGAAVSHVTDPAVVVVATTLTDTDEIVVYHPGTTIEIYPSSIVIAGGNATIQIPRARMVKLSVQDNDENGLVYATTTNFEATVDVKRVYNDVSIQGALTWLHRDSSECDCDCIACCGSCNTYSENACITIRNAESGALDLLSASYADSEWSVVCPTCYCSAPDSVLLNYKAGVLPENLTQQMVTMIIRLAHSKMPSPPCGCGVAQDYWARDRKEPEVITVERAACPFGLSDGAWFAWRQANALKYQRGFALG